MQTRVCPQRTLGWATQAMSPSFWMRKTKPEVIMSTMLAITASMLAFMKDSGTDATYPIP